MATPDPAKARPGFVAALARGDVRALIGKYSDIALAAVVVLIVGMMIIPLPTWLLDLLISLNIAAAVTLLLIAIYVSDALKIATFPTLLLLTTLFRLALEVSATRLILLKADAGELIAAFGNFVVAGNLVVGAVLFFILTVIQFIVIAKGSERVAEVGARFTLDAMPGKQMSIDAELRAGHIDHQEARRRRATLARESQFFGAMDGAMKFVKGDAIAGIVVLLTNIVGGLVIGVVQRGMDARQAAHTYTILTIGEGLVAQIPALIISTAAGIIVTRVAAEEDGAHLGKEVFGQILSQPKALAIAAAMLGLMALVPGLPTVPFLVLALVLGFVAYRVMKDGQKADAGPSDAPVRPGAGRAEGAPESLSPLLTPIAIELGTRATAAIAPALGSGGRFLSEMVPALRERTFYELGIPLPPLRLRRDVPGLPAEGYVVRLHEVALGRGEVVPDAGLALMTGEQLGERGLSGRAAVHPDGSPATWIPADALGEARLRGVATLSCEEVLAAHVLHLMRRYGHEFIGIQETQALLDALEKTHPALVREVVPKLVTPVVLTDVLRRLAEEGVSLRGLRQILGALAEWAPVERDPVALTEQVRAALRRQITSKHVGPSGALSVYLLDPMIEETVKDAIHRTASGSFLALEPALSRDILAAVGRAIAGTPGRGRGTVILTNADVRRFVRRLIETEHPQIPVLSYQELAPETPLQPLGRIAV